MASVRRQKMKRSAIVSGIAIASVITLVAIHFYSLDGLDGWFFSGGPGDTFEDTTEYSSGYTDTAFRQVKQGMTEDKVCALLGPALDRWEIRDIHNTNILEGIGLRWSRSSCDGSYRVRAVNFTNGKVTKRISEFYVD